MRTRYLLTFLMAVNLLNVPPARGAVFDVSTVGGIQGALSAAGGNGQDDTINIAANTYFIGSPLSYNPLPGETGSLTLAGAGAATTIIDGGNRLVFNFQSGTDITISGLTVRNGQSGGDGGGMTATLTGTFTLSGSIIDNNTITVAASDGGGGWVSAQHITISNSTISNNTTTRHGGGLHLTCTDADSRLTITDSTFSGNQKPSHLGYGGGARILRCPNITIRGSTFSGNSSYTPCGSITGGVGLAILFADSVTFTENLVADNASPCDASSAGMVAAQAAFSRSAMLFANNIFSNNTISGVSPYDDFIWLDGSLVTIASDGGSIALVNNVFDGNGDADSVTPDISLFTNLDTAPLDISNNIFFGGPGEDVLLIWNDADENGTTSPTTLRNNIFDPAKVIRKPGGGIAESGNLNADPLFLDAANGNYHLPETSPAVNAGLNTAPGIRPIDFDGNARIRGGTVDIGAFEFPLPDPPPNTFDFGTGNLDMPEVQIGGSQFKSGAMTKAYDVQLTRLEEAGYVFGLKSFANISVTGNPSATYVPTTGVLELPVVEVQGRARTYHVTMQKRPGEFVFDLISARKN